MLTGILGVSYRVLVMFNLTYYEAQFESKFRLGSNI